MGVLSALIDHHADPNTKDAAGHTAVEYSNSDGVKSRIDKYALKHLEYQEVQVRTSPFVCVERPIIASLYFDAAPNQNKTS